MVLSICTSHFLGEFVFSLSFCLNERIPIRIAFLILLKTVAGYLVISSHIEKTLPSYLVEVSLHSLTPFILFPSFDIRYGHAVGLVAV